MKILLILLTLSLHSYGQSSYGSANQDSETNAESPTHLDTGYSNTDVEEEAMEFSGEMGDSSVHPGLPLEDDPQYEKTKKSLPEDTEL